MKGRICAISGPTVTLELPGLRLYDRVRVGEAGLLGEVVRLEGDRSVVQVYEETRGLALGEPALALGKPLTVRLGPALLGGMYDGLQRRLDALHSLTGPFLKAGQEPPPVEEGMATLDFEPAVAAGDAVGPGTVLGATRERGITHTLLATGGKGTVAAVASGEVPVDRPLVRTEDGAEFFAFHDWQVRLPRPYRRKLPQAEPLVTGQRCLDFLFPLARGGTAIIPGGFGTGKTVLEQTIAKFAEVDIVIYVGCGERGNEMAEMLVEFPSLEDPWTQRPLMERTIVVANTSNMPVAAREASIYTAVAMAEYYREMGLHVLLLADSLSRWAEALRELSTAMEEMPGEEGYPTYLTSRMAGFVARAGVVETLAGRIGSLSMILSVSPSGGDFTEPVTQACLRTAGAFLMLDSDLAHRRHFPAIHWNRSYSLYQNEVLPHFETEVDPAWGELRRRTRDLLQRETRLREIADIIGTEGMQDSDRLLLEIVAHLRQDFLSQNAYSEDAFSPPEATFALVRRLFSAYDNARTALEEGEPFDRVLERLSRDIRAEES